MQEHDRPRFVSLMQALAASFRADPTPALFEGYWLGLSDLEIGALQDAVSRAIQSCKFMPVPAELRKLSGEMPAEILTARAWQAVKQAIREHGAYASVNFGPVVNSVILSLGGWERLCATDSEELDKWTRKEFEKYVNAELGSSYQNLSAPKYLPGVHERTNRTNGHEAPATVQIEAIPARRAPMLNGHSKAPQIEEPRDEA